MASAGGGGVWRETAWVCVHQTDAARWCVLYGRCRALCMGVGLIERVLSRVCFSSDAVVCRSVVSVVSVVSVGRARGMETRRQSASVGRRAFVGVGRLENASCTASRIERLIIHSLPIRLSGFDATIRRR